MADNELNIPTGEQMVLQAENLVKKYGKRYRHGAYHHKGNDQYIYASVFHYFLRLLQRRYRVFEVGSHHAVENVENVGAVFFTVLKLTVIHADGKIKQGGKNTV